MTNRTTSPAEPSAGTDEPSDREVSELRAEAIEFELELARRVHRRLQAEISRLQQHAAALEADRASLRNRLDERERYLQAILASRPWRMVQWARGLVGRRW